MTYYHRIVKIGDFYFIEKDREQDAPKTYKETVPVPFKSKEEAINAIESFRSIDDDKCLFTNKEIVWEGI